LRSKLYLLAGGPGSDISADLGRCITETGKKLPSVAYIGTANGDSAAFFARISLLLKTAGAGEVSHVQLLGKDAGTEEDLRIIAESDIVFLSGGEVEDGIVGIPANVKALLRQLYDLGRPFLGVSAGAIMLGAAWPHWDDEDAHPEDAVLFDCLGFAPAVFDTHCEWEDWVELRKAVALSPEGYTGYGIPAGGMVIVLPDGTMVPTVPLDVFRSTGGTALAKGKWMI